MHFRWMAILGLTVAMTGQSAEAARVDRPSVARINVARPMPLVRPAAPVMNSRSVTRQVSTARGGAPRATVSRTSAGRTGGMTAASRGTAPRFASPAGRDRAVVASRHGGGRLAGIQGRQERGAVTRPGFPGYQSAVLRGPGGRFTSMAACSTVRGRRVCGGSRQVAMRWSGGLAPAVGNQSSCPDGTMAMLAVGHENVMRCVPM